ncbi:threonine/homoserine/homoserine lactone efflux protein [Dongia mobilis]|uniref:Threonine/homoserine/homoserine lactone efflux protein n=1 Tax=Dongia mobilis TaxID=578943 RepID=A0A4V3DF06_9PROT|nr:LysE family translocator [Dongia mobilis]TDQ84181.1 threonine/homoserine/homoserine lactone efflux protein [Dongia mobilis]
MLDPIQLGLFLLAAIALAASPGPGMLYVAARTLSGGRSEGLASSFGTALGGMVHVVAGAVGVSAILMASAEVFTFVKLLGAVYLVWLGLRTWRAAALDLGRIEVPRSSSRRAFLEGVVVEALNPKTAAFFLAFVTQFVDPARGNVAAQFILLGAISVALNTAADIVIAVFAARLRRRLVAGSHWLRRLQRASAGLLIALGVALAFARRPAT